MTQHIIAGRFGSRDLLSLPNSSNTVNTIFDLLLPNKKLAYGIGHALDDLQRMGIYPSEVGFDLLLLALHVYAADTRISRITESQDTWTREIHLVVPVSDPEMWNTATPLVKRMLDFLTGDRWTIDFRSRPPEFKKIVPTHLQILSSQTNNVLALFSGGLDSLIGAIDFIESGIKPLFISHASEGATSQAQDNCFDNLQENHKEMSLKRFRMWTKFPEGFIKGVDQEGSTRGRSFLFLAIGVFAGSGINGSFTLLAPENGLIAINVPVDPLRLGSLSTRTMHPFYLSRWNDLLRALGISGSIKNPYWNKTKGEMVLECANQNLIRQLIPISLSCSSPTKGRWLGYSTQHCGFCLPCLIRRAALEKAYGKGNDPTSYTLSDLRSRQLDTNTVEGQQVRSLQFIINRISAQPRLAKLLIHKPGPLSDLSSQDLELLEDVYKRGIGEVADFLNGVKT